MVLALQIFDELRKVGKQHDFSAGLLIGGKDVKAEQQHVNGAVPRVDSTLVWGGVAGCVDLACSAQ